MNVLIVEDEKKVAEAIKKILIRNEKINIVDIVNNYDSAFEKFQSAIYDIILLDIFLGKETRTGLDICKLIRGIDIAIPIIIITGFNSINYLEEAFKLGANDYIRKPFDSRELEIRVIRWAQMKNNFELKKRLKYHELSVELSTNQVQFRKKILKLTKKNKILLKIFIENSEKLLQSTYLKEKLWGDYEAGIKNRNLRSNIQSLRSALKGNCRSWIKTYRGEGYMLKK